MIARLRAYPYRARTGGSTVRQVIEQTEFLTTAAQVAVGLAGFTGVASVFSSRPTAVPAAVQSERLRAMIETALVAVVFSLVPLLLDDAGFSATAVWRVSSVLYLIAWATTFAITVRRGLRVLRGVRLHADRGWAVLVALAGALTFLALLAGSLGFRPSSAYLFALLLQLSLCALFFYRFFLGLRSEPRV